MSLERDLMDLEESLMRNDDCVTQSDYYTIVGLANDAREIEQLVRDMYKALTALDVDYCQACPRDTANGPCTAYVRAYDGCSFAVDMRELGIEVGE